MGSSPSSPSPFLRAQRRRLVWLWLGFGAITFATVFAVFRLYDTVRRELHAQAELARTQQRARALERAREATLTLRLATIKSLVALHSEGLGHALAQWAAATPAVVGTFQWEPEKGFVADAAGSKLLADGDVAALWNEFRAWRAAHPTAHAGSGPERTRSFVTLALRTLDHPALPAGELGYQAENLDILAYAGRPVDPWAGWAGRRENHTRWLLWYQPGPGAPVRGCLLDATPLVAQLKSEFSDSRLARLSFEPSEDKPDAALERWLPGYRLAAAPGDLFTEKQAGAQLAVSTVALLLALFLVGLALLVRASRREIREAELKTTFVTQVSHELRTPLTSIQMFADMLAAPEISADKRTKFAGTISRESQRLGALIERLLRFNAVEQGQLAVAIERVDVAALVRETLDEMDATLRAGGLPPELVPLPAPLCASTDRSALKQALLNLLENALKYARAGGWLRLSARVDAATVCLRIEDRGPGIPRALGERVFEPFVQGGQTLVDKPSGVGLGLSIARGGLRQAGGDLVLVPSAAGAVFEIRLPLAAA